MSLLLTKWSHTSIINTFKINSNLEFNLSNLRIDAVKYYKKKHLNIATFF